MADRRPAFDLDDERTALAAWSRLAEPGDEVAVALIRHLGASAALRWLFDGAIVPDDAGDYDERPARAAGGGRPARAAGGGRPIGAPMPGANPLPVPGARARVARAVGRWTPRLTALDPARELRVLADLGGVLLAPGDPGWPPGLDDLALAAPLCLWVRGAADLGSASHRSVAVVGARACTDYGRRIAGDLAVGLTDRGFTVVSGGAYGIDAVAHRGALTADGRTIAFLAGGVDRFYPAGNATLLQEVLAAGGSLVSEVPPGSAPTRVRFLLRNRLIAAFAAATIVVEAAWRSGALSTAARAAELLRPVGAVPGPVTSAASAGCHRLLRDTDAVCITDPEEAAELAGSHGRDVAGEPEPTQGALDGLDRLSAQLWDALPMRRTASVESVARAAGVAVEEALGALGHLELLGRVARVGGAWRRA